MKVLLILIVSLSFLIAGPKVSNFKLKDLNNKTTSFNKIKGEKLTIIDFWATWCGPCVRAIPELQELYEKHRENGLEVVGVSLEIGRASCRERV